MSPHRTVAILAASSNTGRACLNALLSAPNPPKINALFRTSAKADVVRAAYPDAHHLDLVTGVDAADLLTLRPGLTGADCALLVTPSDPSQDMRGDALLVENMINAAVDAGVKHIVLVGSWTVNAPDRLPLLSSRFQPGERLLKEVEERYSIRWTILRGGYFQSNYPLLTKRIKNGELRFVDFCVPANDPADIGRVAAEVLQAPDPHRGRIYEISGPERIWMRNVVKTIAELIGKDIKFVPVDVAESTQGMPQFLKETYEYIVERGEDAVPMSDSVLKVTGKQPKTFAVWAKENRHSFE